MYKKKYQKLQFTEAFLNDIQTLGGKGFTLTDLRYYFDFEEKAWRAFCDKHPAVDEALQRGKVKMKEFTFDKLVKRMNEGHVAALTFYLKTQGGFSEKHEVGLRDIRSDTIIPDKLGIDPIEALRIYQEIMR